MEDELDHVTEHPVRHGPSPLPDRVTKVPPGRGPDPFTGWEGMSVLKLKDRQTSRDACADDAHLLLKETKRFSIIPLVEPVTHPRGQ